MSFRRLFYFFGFILFSFFNLTCQQRDFLPQPAVIPLSIDQIGVRSIEISAQIIDYGVGFEEYGHCWSTVRKPTILNRRTSLSEILDSDEYQSKLEDLEPSTTYFIRPYIIAGGKAVYGEEMVAYTLSGVAS